MANTDELSVVDEVKPREGVAVSLLEKVGFKTAAAKLNELKTRKRKLALAYEHYRFVRQENIDKFNAQLKAKTKQGQEPYSATWQVLDFMPIGAYEGVPPLDVLKALETAQDRECFDSFEVAHIKNVKDPIIFGRIERCPDRFFIGQWDDDVSIDDLLSPNEG